MTTTYTLIAINLNNQRHTPPTETPERRRARLERSIREIRASGGNPKHYEAELVKMEEGE